MKSFTAYPKVCATIDKLLAILTEHTDAVQVGVTWTDDNGETQCIHIGRGNFHARTGMMHEFLERDKAREHCQVEYTEYKTDEEQE